MHAVLALAAGLVSVGHGIAVDVPPGWHLVSGSLTPCTNPIERLDVAGPGRSLVMVQEALDRAYVHRFSVRPHRFSVEGRPSYVACCDAPGYGKGWVLPFRDGGRSFYAFVYPGTAGVRAALAVLDSLRIARG